MQWPLCRATGSNKFVNTPVQKTLTYFYTLLNKFTNIYPLLNGNGLFACGSNKFLNTFVQNTLTHFYAPLHTFTHIYHLPLAMAPLAPDWL